MDYNNIKQLLDKYFEGNTSIQEEFKLKNFFSSEGDIPHDLLYAKALFTHLKNERELVCNKQLTKPVARKIIYTVSGIAASLFLAMFLLFSYQKQDDKIIYAYINGKAITDKNIAERYTKQVLLAVSQNLEKGTKNLDYLNKLNKVELLIKNNEE